MNKLILRDNREITVQPVYKGHINGPVIMVFIGRLPLYTG